MTQAIRFLADDGYELHGTLHGDAANAKTAVLLAPAMGVPQRFYADFAQWLAAQGHAVLCFDYRGIGASRPASQAASLRGFEADVSTWAERDTAAALAFLTAQISPATPLHWIGHSLGGQIVGLVPGHERVASIVTVGCGSGYWLQNAWKLRLYVWWLWFVICPIVMPLAGYFPGKRLKKIGDLPRGVMTQWRRWCLHRDYLMSEGGARWRERYAAIRAPLLSLSFTDDEYMSAANTASIHGFYSGSAKTMMRIAPRDIGERRIGHFGFFRKRFEATLWPRVGHWLARSA